MTLIEPTTSTSSATPPPAPQKRVARVVTPVLALVAAVGIGIFGGVLIGQNTGSSTQAGPGGSAQEGFGGGAAPDGAALGGGFTSGTVVSVDGDTVVIETTDGEQVTVTTTGDTTVSTTTEGTVADLAAGDTLTVIGEADDAGDVAATAITEGAMGGFPGGGGAPE